jgi:hypothetical protein
MTGENRYKNAYLASARFYRPGAPGDGMGAIYLTPKELDDPAQLRREAQQYAAKFATEKDSHDGFVIGCSDFRTNKAFFSIIEAARLLAGGGNDEAERLLRMALKEIEDAGKQA